MYATLVTGLAAVAGGAWVLSRVPLPPAEVQPETTVILAADGTPIAELHAEVDRRPVDLEEVPGVLVDAVLAAEDRDFFRHPGVDPVAVLRAAWVDVRSGRVIQGGSTITQQYVKNVYLTDERSLRRKLTEAVLALRLEQELGKREILERYLNTVYFGRGAYGVDAAARAYFGTGVTELDLPRAAYLAGLIRAPETADASRDPVEASRRLRSVLDAMVDAGVISRAEAERAAAVDPARIVRPRPASGSSVEIVNAPGIGLEHVVDLVRRELVDRFGAAATFGGGLRVRTTIDLSHQRAAWAAVTGVLDQPGDPAAALVAVDDRGRITAMIGGTDWAASQVNLAVGRAGGGSGRQAGSAFKPFVLAEALTQGISPGSRFRSPARITIPDGPGAWTVSNHGGADHGIIDLVEATVVSSNTVYAQLIMLVGPEAVAATAHRLGVESPVEPLPSVALGTAEVSVLDMAAAYSTFANRGLRIPPTLIAEVAASDGRVLDAPGTRARRVLDAEVADTVTWILRQVVERGTGAAARLPFAVAGKTGTTQSYGDAWFVGYAPRLTAAVWVGYPEGPAHSMSDVRGRPVTGGWLPALIWREFLSAALDGYDPGVFADPPDPLPGRVLSPPTTTTSSTTAPTTAPVSEPVTTGGPTSSPPPAAPGPEPSEAPATTTSTTSTTASTTSSADPAAPPGTPPGEGSGPDG